MTGIERLRAIAGAWDEWGLGGSLTEIADEIERELDRQDEPDSTDKGARLLYVTDEDREAAAWVRDHGGIDHVKAEWRSRVPHDRYVRRRQNLLRHIAECETALGRRNRRIEELGHRVSDLTRENAELRKRAMPEGCEWPRYEDGELVQTGATFAEKGTIKNVVASVELSDDWFAVHGFDGAIDKYSKGERVKRPAVPAADGEPLEVGQTVWDTNGDELVVGAIEDGGHTVTCRYADVGDSIPTHGMWSPSDLTHQRPVLDADGVPIKKGDTVYWLEHTVPFTVVSPHETRDNAGQELKCGHTVEVMRDGHKPHMYVHPESLHHTKPEPPDSWERVEEDAERLSYNTAQDAYHGMDMSKELCDGIRGIVRRCKALAERERGE